MSTTRLELLSMPSFFRKSNKHRRGCPSTSTLPNFDDPHADHPELRSLSTAPSIASTSPLDYALSLAPSSTSTLSPFCASKSLQIETLGQPLLVLPFCSRSTATIAIHAVDSITGQIGPPAYQSVKRERGSSSGSSSSAGTGTSSSSSSGTSSGTSSGSSPGCSYRELLRAGDKHPICATTYRFGPGRSPKLQLCGALACDEEITVKSKGLTTRSQVLRTHLGTFQWRYVSRKERRRNAYPALGSGTILVLEKITYHAVAGGRQEKERRQVARLVRNAEFRTEGTKRSTAGNGGRLMMDLGDWADRKAQVVEQVEALIVASCLVMLKKERDRRRMNQGIVIGGASGGGGGGA